MNGGVRTSLKKVGAWVDSFYNLVQSPLSLIFVIMETERIIRQNGHLS